MEANGYLIEKRPEHPRSWKNGYQYQHILVAEAILGRYLSPDEVVHHQNGDKHDNRPSNLEVLTRAEHASHHAKPRTMVSLTCSFCNERFDREKRQVKKALLQQLMPSQGPPQEAKEHLVLLVKWRSYDATNVGFRVRPPRRTPAIHAPIV